jgi:iron complex outermembrane receptor protein
MTGEQIEIGLRWRPAQRSLVTLALFELKQQNILTLGFGGSDTIGESRVRGVEVEAKANFDRWDLSFAYAYADSEVTRSFDIAVGTPLADNPHQATLWSVYKLACATPAVTMVMSIVFMI